ncbi:MAG: VacJ family lipoprotein [Planctomycetota bacterium]
MNPPRIRALLMAGLLLLASACAATEAREGDNDPLQGMNRFFFGVNHVVDSFLFKPVSGTYVAIVPKPARQGVTNFYYNLTYPGVFLNDFLQGKFHQGGNDFLRFLINSTIGIGGLLDVASSMGFERHEEDFGQTLAVWGAGDGPYLVLPLFGPTTVRDAPGIGVSAVTNPAFYIDNDGIIIPLTVIQAIDRRARGEKGLETIEKAVDPYIFMREAYRQHRQFLIYDGNPPQEEVLQGLEEDLQSLEDD